MFKNLNWKSFSNPQAWDSYKDSFYELILLAEEKNNKPILDFLLQFRYPWLTSES
jgi:hypothetical protein